jgi:AraC family transcriptional regulator
MNLYLQGSVPAVYPSTPTDLIVCALDPVFVEEVSAEQKFPLSIRLRERMVFYDGPVASLIRLIEGEAKSGGASGRLYLDHLAFALTLRLLNFGTKNEDPHISSSPLSHPRLKRVVERMESDLDKDIDLRTLAVESGYSTTHFLRMFRAATGYTPHRYLLLLRVARAQDLMKNKGIHLIDIALACGFSSHAQLSRVFRQIVGVTPSGYRRTI